MWKGVGNAAAIPSARSFVKGTILVVMGSLECE